MPEPIPRRDLLSAAASSLRDLAAAGSRPEIVATPDGDVCRWECADLLVLLSGLGQSFRLGDQVHLRLILNNQAATPGRYQLRMKLARPGRPIVRQTPLANLEVKPYDAATIESSLRLAAPLQPGSYQLMLELRPWAQDGRQTGGVLLRAPLQIRS